MITISLENDGVSISLENDDRKFDISLIRFKIFKGRNLKFNGVSNWNKGFVFKHHCTKIEALFNNEVIGQVGLEDEYDGEKTEYGYIFGVSVKPKYQNQHLGTDLMIEIEKYAKSIHMKQLLLRPATEKVKHFYKKLGYKYDHKDEYGVVMSKNI